jgi:hypothetical protein
MATGFLVGLAAGLLQLLGLRWDAPPVALGLSGFELVLLGLGIGTALLCLARPRSFLLGGLAVLAGWALGLVGWVVGLLLEDPANDLWPLSLMVNLFVGAAVIGLGVIAGTGCRAAFRTRRDE